MIKYFRKPSMGQGHDPNPSTVRFDDPSVTPVRVNGALTNLLITTAGAYYLDTPPTVAIAPAPARVQATATVTVTGGVVTAVTPVAGGNFYTTAPAVTITDTNVAPGSAAAVTAVLTNGQVTSYIITNGGTGYHQATTTAAVDQADVAVSGTVTAVLGNGYLVSATVADSNNSGFTSAPTLAFSNGAQGYAEVDLGSQKIVRIVITDVGQTGLAAAPTVTLTGGKTGTQPVVTCHFAGQVTSFTSLTGSGYLTIPSVTFTSPNALVVTPAMRNIEGVDTTILGLSGTDERVTVLLPVPNTDGRVAVCNAPDAVVALYRTATTLTKGLTATLRTWGY